MGLGVILESDFNDYYDTEFDGNTYKHKSYVYNRMRNNRNHRTIDLLELKKNGIPVLSLNSIARFQLLSPNTKLLVYTRPTLHTGNGKIVLENREAQDLYPNMPGRIWLPHSETEGYSVKYLQIGKRRFKIMLKGDSDLNDLTPKVLNIIELDPEYSRWNKHPIYSVDYIPTKDGLMATDYNIIEDLKRLGMESIISPKEVHSEIVNSFNYFY